MAKTAKRPAKGKTTPKGKAGKAKPEPKTPAKGKTKPTPKATSTSSAPTRRRAGLRGEQTEIPGTQQKKDAVLEREYLARKQALKDAKDAAERKAQATANIHARFDKIREDDPEDPRALSYRVEDGDVLRPQQKPDLKITRKPSREAKAEAKAKAKSASSADEPDLPDDDAPGEDDDSPFTGDDDDPPDEAA